MRCTLGGKSREIARGEKEGNQIEEVGENYKYPAAADALRQLRLSAERQAQSAK